MSEIKIGLSKEEIQAHLLQIGAPGESISISKLTDSVARVIDENNKRLLQDIYALLAK
ncbi:hypothetical protein [Paenibacillus oryzisoli]|uniref:hypothetical protein n=1 Tax=Paenibacillus oryzisoli TaxID=1850517 RepID=UPI0012FC5E16|nr:hypothetical protein [Paenibacillus oryzisoli]